MSGGSLERHEEVTLIEAIDRVIDKGVVLTGDIVLSVADVDLVYLGVQLLLASHDTAARMGVGGLRLPPDAR